MENKLKSAFDGIHADEALREDTKAFLHKKLYGKRYRAKRPALAIASLALLLFFCAGYFSYYTPVAAVSVDINPSLELEVNLFDRVIRVTGYNEEGKDLTKDLQVVHMNYSDALNAILESEPVLSYLRKDELLEVTVSGSGEKSKAISSCISSQTTIEKENIHCCKSSEEAAQAHAAGLSLGKYRAFLELQKLDPSATTESVSGLSMRQIRDKITEAASASSPELETKKPGVSSSPTDDLGSVQSTSSSCAGTASGQGDAHGNCQGNGQGNGQTNGQGNGQGNGQRNGQGNGRGNGQGSGQGHRRHGMGNGNCRQSAQ